MQATRSRRQLPVFTVDGKSVVSHAGTALLRELADRVGRPGGFSTVLARSRHRRRVHDPGQVTADLAVTIADGGAVISDLRTLLADQELLHGQVASTATAWHTGAGVGRPRRTHPSCLARACPIRSSSIR